MEFTLLKYQKVDEIVAFIRSTTVSPCAVNPYLESINSSLLTQNKHIESILMRPDVKLEQLMPLISELRVLFNELPPSLLTKEVVEAVEIEIKYSGYIGREQQEAEKNLRLESKRIPHQVDFTKILSISTEGRMKLAKIRPETVGEASRIPGISPSDISAILIYLGR
jgi:tRNA uridine 5-carboxymethylaminomethyl modification enzyme